MIGKLYVSHSTTPKMAEFQTIPYHSASINWRRDDASTLSFSSPVSLATGDRVRYQSKYNDFGGQIYKVKKTYKSDYQYECISYLRLYHDKVTYSCKNKTSSEILREVLKLSKNQFRTGGIKKTELVHQELKWENKSIWDIAKQLAWIEQQAGYKVETYVDANGNLFYHYLKEEEQGYSFNTVLSYEEDYDATDLITASQVTFNGQTLANVEASSDVIAKWGYVTEIEECQAEQTSSDDNTTNTTTNGSGKRDDAQIQKYGIPEAIVKQALSLTDANKSDKENLKAIYEWENHNVGWVDYRSTQRGALKTMQRRGGNCCDNAHLMIALARSVGIKARYVHAKKQSGKKYGHVWGEYYVNNGWFTVDTGTSSTTKYWGSHCNYGSNAISRYEKLPF